MRKTEALSTKENGILRFFYGTAFGRVLLRPVISRPVSFLCGSVLSCSFSKCLIKGFIKANNIDMSEYEEYKYSSFNDFFTRKIKPGNRIPASGEDILTSPCDARLSVYECSDDRFTIKGVDYTLSELLKDDDLAARFKDGYCLIFRLAVNDYHRYSFPANGIFTPVVHIKGKYHTVRPIAMSKYKIFRENVREYTVINTENLGDILQMEVGALNVGKIANKDQNGGTAVKGAEKGMFLFGGSTVILLTEKGKIVIDEEFFENTRNGLETIVKYGECIGIRDKGI